MARTLPRIQVKETSVNRRIKIPSQLNQKISQFAAFYEAQLGQRPEETSVIVGILDDYFSNNTEFKQFIKDHQKGTKGATSQLRSVSHSASGDDSQKHQGASGE